MRFSAYFLLILSLVFSASFIIAEESDEEAPPGMEVIQIGDAKVITIKGTKIKKKGDLLVVEGTKEFVARKFIELEETFSKLEERTSRLEKEVEKLKKTLGEIEKEKPTEVSATDTTHTVE